MVVGAGADFFVAPVPVAPVPVVEPEPVESGPVLAPPVPVEPVPVVPLPPLPIPPLGVVLEPVAVPVDGVVPIAGEPGDAGPSCVVGVVPGADPEGALGSITLPDVVVFVSGVLDCPLPPPHAVVASTVRATASWMTFIETPELGEARGAPR